MMNDNKYAVITGGSSGIGAAVAQDLCAAGYSLFLVSRRVDTLKEVAKQLERPGVSIRTVAADVSVENDIRNLVREIRSVTERIDVLFNNAGSGEALSIEDTTMDCWNQTIGSSLTGTFLCCKELLPLLRVAGSPLIINNASIAAHRGFPNFAAYSAAKGGVLAFSRALREELRMEGIRVVTLSPGATDTSFWDNVKGEWDRSKMIPVRDMSQVVMQIIESPKSLVVEDVTIMPSGGAL